MSSSSSMGSVEGPGNRLWRKASCCPRPTNLREVGSSREMGLPKVAGKTGPPGSELLSSVWVPTSQVDTMAEHPMSTERVDGVPLEPPPLVIKWVAMVLVDEEEKSLTQVQQRGWMWEHLERWAYKLRKVRLGCHNLRTSLGPWMVVGRNPFWPLLHMGTWLRKKREKDRH